MFFGADKAACRTTLAAAYPECRFSLPSVAAREDLIFFRNHVRVGLVSFAIATATPRQPELFHRFA